MKHQNNRNQRAYQSYVLWFSKMKSLYTTQPGSAHLLSTKHLDLPEEDHKLVMEEAMNRYVEEMNKYNLFKNKKVLRSPRTYGSRYFYQKNSLDPKGSRTRTIDQHVLGD